LEHQQVYVRISAAVALWQVDKQSDKAVATLIPPLQHQDLKVRCDAARALTDIGPAAKAAVPALLEAAKQKDGYGASNRAREALQRIDPEAAKQVEEH
jgi:HEAT repeat protein